VEDSAGWQVAVLAAVTAERLGEQGLGVAAGQVRLPVAAGDLGGAPRTMTPSPRWLNTWATLVCRVCWSVL
jgi:hypothetical protein